MQSPLSRFSRLSRNWKIAAGFGAVLGAVGIYLFFFVFAFHLKFIDDKVDEATPVFASGAGEMMPEPVDEVTDKMVDPSMTEPPEPVPAHPEMDIVEVVAGEFTARSHPAAGTASVLNDGTDQRFLRFEDFSTDNGPDLNVYLSSAPLDAPAGEFDDDFVDLGDLKGNIGDQNYEIPVDVDLSVYKTVVIWCVRFAVAFGAAELA